MEDKTNNKGFLFLNPDRLSKNSPTYKGYLQIDNDKIQIAAWYKTSKKTGKKYLSIAIDPIKNRTDNYPAYTMNEQGEMEEVF
jgi:uncharacterized protein (DUF736 family)